MFNNINFIISCNINHNVQSDEQNRRHGGALSSQREMYTVNNIVLLSTVYIMRQSAVVY